MIGACVHCRYPAEPGLDVCRFCPPHFGYVEGRKPPRCAACSGRRPHTPEDLSNAELVLWGNRAGVRA